MAEHGLGTEQAVVEQALHRTHAVVVLQGVVDVVHALGHVDVEAREAVVGLGHEVHGLVGEGEGGVAAEHGGDHGGVLLGAPAGEVGVLLDALVALLDAVAV